MSSMSGQNSQCPVSSCEEWSEVESCALSASEKNTRSWFHAQLVSPLAKVIETIKTNPCDRRILLTAWNPNDLDQMALPPCHMFAQVPPHHMFSWKNDIISDKIWIYLLQSIWMLVPVTVLCFQWGVVMPDVSAIRWLGIRSAFQHCLLRSTNTVPLVCWTFLSFISLK
jgi:hypothetical protein